MVECFEDADLSGDAFDIGLVLDFFFLEGLDCNFFLGVDVGGDFDLAEGALADGAACLKGFVPTR